MVNRAECPVGNHATSALDVRANCTHVVRCRRDPLGPPRTRTRHFPAPGRKIVDQQNEIFDVGVVGVLRGAPALGGKDTPVPGKTTMLCLITASLGGLSSQYTIARALSTGQCPL